MTVGTPTTASDATLGGNISTTNGNVTFNGDFTTLAGDVTVRTGTGAISFTGAVDGAYNLSLVSSGTILVNGPMGGTTPLTSLTTGTGQTELNGDVNTTGAQYYGGDITVLGPLIMNAGSSNVTLTSTVYSAPTTTPLDFNSLTVKTSGLATFDGAIDLGGELLRMGTGSTVINANVTTATNQNYQGAVTLNASNLTATTGDCSVHRRADARQRMRRLARAAPRGYQAINGRPKPGAIRHPGLASRRGGCDDGAVQPSDACAGSALQHHRHCKRCGDDRWRRHVERRCHDHQRNWGPWTFTGTVDGADGLTITNSGGVTFGGKIGMTTPLTSLADRFGSDQFRCRRQRQRQYPGRRRHPARRQRGDQEWPPAP